MVYYYEASAGSTSEYDDFGLGDEAKYTIYMGRDKVENEPLIHKLHPKNLWFHVDKHSSAHVYLQLTQEQQAQRFEDLSLPEPLLQQLAQLTKANSIKANKLNNIVVIYTPVDNLRSDGLMDVGTVTFVNPQKIKRVLVAKKENSIVNKLNKTKREVSTDEFVKSQEAQLQDWRRLQKEELRKAEQRLKEEAKAYQQQKAFNKDPYATMFTEENLRGSSNEFRAENWVEDEFW